MALTNSDLHGLSHPMRNLQRRIHVVLSLLNTSMFKKSQPKKNIQTSSVQKQNADSVTVERSFFLRKDSHYQQEDFFSNNSHWFSYTPEK